MDMKIVVLDGCAANSGDISWDSIGKYGELTVYDRTDRSEVVSRIGDAEIITTNKTVIDRAVIEACPNLRYIGVLATGYNVVDVEAAHEHGIVVTNVPGYSTDAVAQFTFALLLELANRVGAHDASVKDGGWVRSKDFSQCDADHGACGQDYGYHRLWQYRYEGGRDRTCIWHEGAGEQPDEESPAGWRLDKLG